MGVAEDDARVLGAISFLEPRTVYEIAQRSGTLVTTARAVLRRHEEDIEKRGQRYRYHNAAPWEGEAS